MRYRTLSDFRTLIFAAVPVWALLFSGCDSGTAPSAPNKPSTPSEPANRDLIGKVAPGLGASGKAGKGKRGGGSSAKVSPAASSR